MAIKSSLGLRNNSRSPGSIANAQHHDPTGSEKDLSGSPAAIKEVVADSTVATSVENFSIIRLMNRDTSVQYLWIGLEGDEPGTVNDTNGMALTPQFHEVMYLPASNDPQQAITVKSSNSLVHVVIMES